MKLANIFTDNMIFQQNAEIRIFGTCRNGEKISAQIGESKAEITANDEKFLITLDAVPCGCEYTLTVNGDNETVLENIGIGEVFIAAGQSNMEMPLSATNDCMSELMDAENLDIRYFTVPHRQMPGYDSIGWMFKRVECIELPWMIVDMNNGLNMSATGFYFAKKLAEKLNVPIGIIECNWGGTSIFQWLDEKEILNADDSIADVKELINIKNANKTDEYYKLAFDHMKMMEKIYDAAPDGTMITYPSGERVTDRTNPYNPSAYGALYESMFKTIIPFCVNGVIWYQGESDRNYPNSDIKARYKTGFRLLEKIWRRDLMNPQMPIFTVQIAPYDDPICEGVGEECPCAIIREAQYELSRDENVYMISLGDSGEMRDIHPRNKSVVGKRLANCALSVLYGMNIPWKSPVFNRAVRKDGVIKMYFDDTYGGLLANQSPIFNVELKADGKWQEVIFWIENDYIFTDTVKESDENRERINHIIENATEIRFCYKDWYVTNLFSRAGLPALPFEKENIKTAK